MSFMDQIGGLINQYAAGNGATSREEAREHYDQIAGAVPPGISSTLQALSQPSLFRVFPSSHCSGGSTKPSPQRAKHWYGTTGGLVRYVF